MLFISFAVVTSLCICYYFIIFLYFVIHKCDVRCFFCRYYLLGFTLKNITLDRVSMQSFSLRGMLAGTVLSDVHTKRAKAVDPAVE